jgi:hypothetical protein
VKVGAAALVAACLPFHRYFAVTSRVGCLRHLSYLVACARDAHVVEVAKVPRY